MVYICSICFEPLTKEPESGTLRGHATIPCGHVFHTYCIQTWLNVKSDGVNGLYCPLCRKNIPKKKILPLVLNSGNDDDEDANCDHGDLIAQLRSDNQTLKNSLDQHTRKRNFLEEDFKRVKSQLKNEQAKNENLSTQITDLRYFETIADESERRSESLALELKKFEYIDVLLKNSKFAIEDQCAAVIASRPSHDAIKVLIEMQQAMKKELSTCQNKLDDVQKKYADQGKQLVATQAKHHKLTEKYKELYKVHNNSINTSVGPPTPITSSGLKRGSPLRMNNDNTTKRRKLAGKHTREEDVKKVDDSIIMPVPSFVRKAMKPNWVKTKSDDLMKFKEVSKPTVIDLDETRRTDSGSFRLRMNVPGAGMTKGRKQ